MASECHHYSLVSHMAGAYTHTPVSAGVCVRVWDPGFAVRAQIREITLKERLALWGLVQKAAPTTGASAGGGNTADYTRSALIPLTLHPKPPMLESSQAEGPENHHRGRWVVALWWLRTEGNCSCKH